MARPMDYHYLTEEQKKFCEDNIGYVYYFLSKLNLPDTNEKEELISALFLAFCLAVENYDGSTKFTYFASFYLRGAVSRFYKQNKFFHSRVIVNSDLVDSEDTKFNPHKINKHDIDLIMERSNLEKVEKDVLEKHYLQQLPKTKISKECKMYVKTVYDKIQSGLYKIQSYIKESGNEIDCYL